MTRIIPPNLIEHLKWDPKQEPPQRSPIKPTPKPEQQEVISIDDILNGQTFYDNSLPVAMQQALDYATPKGIVVTMPELIAAKLKADKSHDFWQYWYTVHSEENIGTDTKGRFYNEGEPILVVVHGGGILTPKRIKKAYKESLINDNVEYSKEEFNNLLEGKLPNGDSIQLHTIKEIIEGVSKLPHRFGVVMPYSAAQNTKSGYHKKKEFMENPLVIARAGGMENLEAYFKRAKDSDGDVANWHLFKSRDLSTPQGRVLFLHGHSFGLTNNNYSLSQGGRFIGVAPETRSDAGKYGFF